MKRLIAASLYVSASLFAAQDGVRLINGKPVDPGTWKEVVNIKSNGSGCTATVVGPRVIITAAHCASNGATATFSIGGISYSAKITRSSLYPAKDHDVALGLTSEDIKVEPATIGGKSSNGVSLTILGYGCINPGGGGGNDGVLRIGTSEIVGTSGYDMVSRKANGAALCFGDSGGPAFVSEGGKFVQLGINSKGNIQDTNYNTRLDIPESQTFIKDFASSNNVKICGINLDCNGVTPPTPPSCTMGANPSKVKPNVSVAISLFPSGEVTSASIEGQTIANSGGQISTSKSQPGNYIMKGTVSGPGGTGNCQTNFTVEQDDPTPTAPTCTLTAFPSSIKLGDSLTVEMQTAGQATSGSIDSVNVSVPKGSRVLTPGSKGNFTATGTVSGPGGSSNCWASYSVDDGTTPPNTPNFAVVPAYCGMNILVQTPVKKVCLAVVKKDASMDLKVTDSLILHNADGTKEVMPIISRRPRPKTFGDQRSTEDLSLFANGVVEADGFSVLDTRSAILTKLGGRRSNAEVPYTIEGRSTKGYYFIVEKLDPFAVSK